MRKTIIVLIALYFIIPPYLFGQGKMYKSSGHYIGLLDFFNNHPFKNENGRITHPNTNTNGLLNSKNGWFEEQGIKVKGLLSSAALQVDWWLLFNEPTEQYEFQWQSSGNYDIQFIDNKGKPVSTNINRASLEKYPDLFKRFNALQPTDIQFEIKWRIGDQAKKNNDLFQKKYKLMGSIGSTMPHVKNVFTTTIKNGILFEPSGKKPFATPSIRQGAGKDFLGLASSYNDQKLKEVFDYWKISEGHVINSFRVIKQNWPVQEMKAIAEKFLRYEKGEKDLSPKEIVAQELEKSKNLNPYNKNDFWGDAIQESKEELTVTKLEEYRKETYFIKNLKTNEVLFKSNNEITQVSKKIFTETSNSGHPNYIIQTKLIDQKGKLLTIDGQNTFSLVQINQNKELKNTISLYTLIKSSLIRKNVFKTRANYFSFRSRDYNKIYDYVINYNGGTGIGTTSDVYIYEYYVIIYNTSNKTIVEKYKEYSVSKL